jgi:hypothetical protein
MTSSPSRLPCWPWRLTEAAACLGHRLTLRAIPAVAADFAVWLLVFILAADTIPEGYLPASGGTIATLCFLLLAVYGASIGVRSFALRHPITIFEIGQAVIAFALASYGVLRATHGSISQPLGAVFILLAAACNWGSLFRFTQDDQARNRRVSATWAAALLLAGTFLLFPANLQIPFLCAAAAAATLVYTRTRKLSLGMHASFYLAAATAVSTLPAYAADAVAENVPGIPDWRVWIVAVTAALCYGIGASTDHDQGRRRLLWVTPAALVAFTCASLAIVAIVGLVSRHLELAASSLSVIRTVVICAVTLTLGFLGSLQRRIELAWLAYAAVALGTLKLLMEDLRFGNAASLVVSLLFYGLILILPPRVTKREPA